MAVQKAWKRRMTRSVVSFLFTVQLVTLVTCNRGQCYSSTTFEENNFLNLNVKKSFNLLVCSSMVYDFIEMAMSDVRVPKKLGQDTQIRPNPLRQINLHFLLSQDCLQDFTKGNILSDSICTNCGKVGSMTKQTMLGRLPPYLIVQLKR